MKWYVEAGISKDRFMELKYIAKQYDIMRENESKLRRGEIDRTEAKNDTWKRTDPTGNTAIANVTKSNASKIKAIEDSLRIAASEVGRGIYGYLLDNVARGKQYKFMNPKPPCGEVQFYRARLRFFVELDARVA